MTQGGDEKSRLPLELEVVGIPDNGTVIATESGHRFLIPESAVADRNPGATFRLDPPGLTDIMDDETRPVMARALLNELIGAPGREAEKDD
jgi:hypothetical protein